MILTVLIRFMKGNYFRAPMSIVAYAPVPQKKKKNYFKLMPFREYRTAGR